MEDLEKQMWRKVKKYMRFLNFVPFLRMVAVCNNLAFSNLNPNSDIDLFIVAKTGRLFIVRIFVTGVLHLLGVRRHENKVAGRFCLSFFVDDSSLDLSSIAIEDDVYLKVWIKTLVPLIDDGVYEEFKKINFWVDESFDSFPTVSFLDCVSVKSSSKSFFEWMLGGSVGNFFERILSVWQLKRAEEKAATLEDSSNLLISEHILKFHNFDRRREYRGLWRSKFGDDKLTLEKFRQLCVKKN